MAAGIYQRQKVSTFAH